MYMRLHQPFFHSSFRSLCAIPSSYRHRECIRSFYIFLSLDKFMSAVIRLSSTRHRSVYVSHAYRTGRHMRTNKFDREREKKNWIPNSLGLRVPLPMPQCHMTELRNAISDVLTRNGKSAKANRALWKCSLFATLFGYRKKWCGMECIVLVVNAERERSCQHPYQVLQVWTLSFLFIFTFFFVFCSDVWLFHFSLKFFPFGNEKSATATIDHSTNAIAAATDGDDTFGETFYFLSNGFCLSSNALLIFFIRRLSGGSGYVCSGETMTIIKY